MNTPVRLGRGLLTRLGLAAFASGLAASAAAAPASADLQSWPAGASPQEIGRRVAERFIASPHPNFAAGRKSIIYPEVCAWYGALTFAQLAGDRDLTAKLARRFDPLFGPEAYLIPQPIHVDLTVFAAVPLQLYIETKDPRYLQIGQPMADAQWDKPLDPAAIAQTSAAPVDPAIAIEAVKAGLTPQTRYWVDDMYMITIAPPGKWLPISTSCRSPTASFIMPLTFPTSGAAATAGSPWAWPNSCGRCRRTIPCAHASWRATGR
jgi:unsaturated rhamnogalacturonyl hydrolase